MGGSVACLTRELALADATPDDIVHALTKVLPWRVVTTDPEPIVDGLLAFLIWAVKRGRIRERRVEYTCRKIRRDALEAMRDPREWSPAKQLLMSAIRDGVDPSDIDAVRDHALAHGGAPAFVDEFVYPQVMFVNGEWRE